MWINSNVSTYIMKYIKLITRTPEQAKEQDNKQAAKTAKARLELSIAQKKQEIASAETKVEDLKASRDFNPTAIYNAQNTVDLLNREVTQLNALLTELF